MKSLPMLDPIVAPQPADETYVCLPTGNEDRDRRMSLLQLLQAYLSGSFEDLGTLSWDKDQPITNVPAWRSQFPSGDLEQGWLNLREVLDPVSSVGLSWNITSENPVVALGSYTQSIRVAVSGNSASARTFTLTGTPRAGQEIWFFVGTANLTTPATIKHADDTLATVRGGELVRVYTLGTELVAQVVAGSQNLGRASDLTWLTGPLLEQWFTGLGWTDATHPGWTGDQLLTVLNAFGPTYQEAAASAAAARKLSEELSGTFNTEAVWVTDTGTTASQDGLSPCRAVRVRGYIVDAASAITDASFSLEMGLTTIPTGPGSVQVRIETSAEGNPALFAFLAAVASLGHALCLPCAIAALSNPRIGTARIFAYPQGLATIRMEVHPCLDLSGGTLLTWDDLAAEFPGGSIKLHLHTTFPIPAPPAA